MPQVIPAAAAAWAGSAAAAANWSTFAVSLTQFAVAAATSAIVSKLTEKRGFGAEQRASQVVLRSAVEAQRIIYGERVVSGPLIFSTVYRDTRRSSERHRIPVASPFNVQVNNAGEFRGNVQVSIVSGENTSEGYIETRTLLTAVSSSPGANEYSVSSGVYTFNSTRAVQDVQIIYDHGADTNASTWLHLVIPLAGHEIEEISDIYFGSDVIATGDLDSDGNVVSGKYARFAKIRKHLGTAGDPADAWLVSMSDGRWTADHKGEGIAYIVVSLMRNQNLYTSGVPNIRAKVRGAKLYDPRTATTAYSNNWALVVRDYLTRAEGLTCDDAEVNDTLLNAAANVSDENVDLDSVPTTQKRYTADGVVSLDGRPIDVLRELLGAGAGTAVYSVSTWDVYAGAYVSPTRTLTVSDLRAEIAGAADLPRRDIFNAVRGTFVNPDADWQATSFPPVENATYTTEDGGEQIFRDIELPFTTNVVRAQRIAKIALERARQGATLAWPGKLTCFRLNTWETVNVEVAQLGFSPKVFRVNGWQWEPGGGVDLALQEEAAAAYDWNFGEATEHDLAANTTLPATGPLAPPGAPVVTEELYETRDSRGVAARANVSWAASVDVYATRYEFEYKLTSADIWTRTPPRADLKAAIDDIAPGTYDFRVRAGDELGRTSGYSQDRAEINGFTATPSAPTGLSIQAGGGTARLKFDPSPDLDVLRGGRVLVRFCHDTAPVVSWEESFSIGEPEGWPGDSTQVDVPLKPGTYLVKFQDSTEHESATWAEIETKQASVLAFSTLATLTYEPDFQGVFLGTANADGQLTLGGAGLVDDIPDFDAVTDLDGYGGIEESGTWTADTGMDLASVKNVRLTSRLEGSVENILDEFDDRTGNIDDWENFDGTSGFGSSSDAWLEARETDDDPAGTPVWSDWKRLDAAEFLARAFQLRGVLRSTDPAYRPLVGTLRVTAEEVV